jgi:HEAT repeat protein
MEDVIDTPEQAVRILGESERVQAREKAVDFLADAPLEIAQPALVMALDDPAPEVIVAAIEGLSGLGGEEALVHILRTLKHDHPGVRQSAVLAVSLLGTSRNVRDLKPLERDKDASVSAAAEMAIRKLSTQRP